MLSDAVVADRVASVDGMVHCIASRLAQHGITAPFSFEDFVGYGYIGAVEAARAYDPTRDTAFSSFAFARIRGAIIDAIRNARPLTRREACDGVQRQVIPVSRLAEFHKKHDDDDDLLDRRMAVEDPDPTPEEQAVVNESVRMLNEAIDSLEPRLAYIVRHHDLAGDTVIVVANHLGISWTRVFQLRKSALKNMLCYFQAHGYSSTGLDNGHIKRVE